MLDASLNQGAGLHGIAAPAAPRVITLVSHGDRAAELPLLWNLCSAWVDLGYPVAVLDVTDAESASKPGFEQLLADSYWHSDLRQAQMTCSVLPAAHGFERLCHEDGHGRFPLQQLGSWFPHHEIVLIYANAATVASSLAGSGIEPLLALSNNSPALVTAYQGLKQLLLKARLRPIMVSIAESSAQTPSAPNQRMREKLQSCAMTFLGYPLHVLSARAQASDQPMTADMNQLALALLEKAVTLHRSRSVMLQGPGVNAGNHFARSH